MGSNPISSSKNFSSNILLEMPIDDRMQSKGVRMDFNPHVIAEKLKQTDPTFDEDDFWLTVSYLTEDGKITVNLDYELRCV